MLKVKKLVPEAKLPKQAEEGDSGYDLFSVEDCILWPFCPRVIGTGVSIELVTEEPAIPVPTNSEALIKYPEAKGMRPDIQIRGRSGLAGREHILAHVGTIELAYRKELKVALFPFRFLPYRIRKGDRIGQLVLGWQLQSQPVVEYASLNETNRSGFASTGR